MIEESFWLQGALGVAIQEFSAETDTQPWGSFAQDQRPQIWRSYFYDMVSEVLYTCRTCSESLEDAHELQMAVLEIAEAYAEQYNRHVTRQGKENFKEYTGMTDQEIDRLVSNRPTSDDLMEIYQGKA